MTAQRSVSSSASTKRPISPVVSLPTSRKASQQSTPAAQPADLSTLLGAHLSITIDDNTHQGYLYAYDLGMLVLETPHKSEWAPGSAPLSDRPKSDFNLYKASNIKSVSVLSGGDSKAVSSVKDVDFGWVSQREQQEVRKEEERLKRLPPKGVSRLGAEVHNALSKSKFLCLSLRCLANANHSHASAVERYITCRTRINTYSGTL